MASNWYTGKKVSYMCHKCGGKQSGTVRRSGPAWDVHLSCGHVHRAGWTMPVDELRKRGLVQTETPIDPRGVIAKKQREEDRDREFTERVAHHRRQQEFTRGKYL